MRAALPLLLAPLLGCGGPADPPAEGPHVVLVTLDTLRADHTSLLGYGRPTTPRLEELARTSTVYERCVATAPWTVPTHASLFTGRFPFEHGARSTSLAQTQGGGDNVTTLSPEHVTLAELLRDAGWDTAAFVTNRAYLAPRMGLDQGYDLYDVEGGRAELRNRRVFEWLTDQDPTRPLHLFLNYMDTHRPYNTRPRPAFTTDEVPRDAVAPLNELYVRVLAQGEDPPPALVALLHAQYDLSIANVDAEIGALVDLLVELGFWEDTLFVVTSDHGEYFGEHALVEHSKDVYEEALAVPLLVHAPGQTQGDRVAERVSLAHLPRIVAAHLPQEVAAAFADAFPHAPFASPVLAQNSYARRKDLEDPRFGARFDRVRSAWYEGDLKYVHSSDGAHELYDLSTDPAEARDLVLERAEDAARLRADLLAFLASSPWRIEGVAASEALTPEDVQALVDMGYAGED